MIKLVNIENGGFVREYLAIYPILFLFDIATIYETPPKIANKDRKNLKFIGPRPDSKIE